MRRPDATVCFDFISSRNYGMIHGLVPPVPVDYRCVEVDEKRNSGVNRQNLCC